MKTGITKSQIESIVRENLGEKTTKIKRAKGGVVNDAFFVSTPKKELVFRISPNRWCRFESEKWCFEECRKIGLPVPRVFAVGNIKLPNFDYPLTYSILERIPGKPLNNSYPIGLLKNSSLAKFWYRLFPNLRKILEESGRLLAKIHSIKTEGFGWLAKPGVGINSSWQEFIFSLISDEQFSTLLNTGLLEPKEKEAVVNLFESQKDLFDLEEGRLLHGDFGAGAIIVQKGRITGIIDFENAISGDPLYDLSIPTLYADLIGAQGYIQDIFNGYGVNLDKIFEQKLFLYQLATAISRMAWGHKEGLKKHTKLLQRWLRRQIQAGMITANPKDYSR